MLKWRPRGDEKKTCLNEKVHWQEGNLRRWPIEQFNFRNSGFLVKNLRRIGQLKYRER